MATQPQRPLALVVARELASNLATPMFLIDDQGDLVYYNDAAEQIFGRSFAEIGTMNAADWAAMMELEHPDGERLLRRDTPPGVAFMQRKPSHMRLRMTSADGSKHLIDVTAYPLFAKAGEMHGVVAIFWNEENVT